MILLIAGLLLFIGNHSVKLLLPKWRNHFMEQYGANTWKLIYSVFSLVGLGLIIYGYGLTRTDPVFIWNPPVWTRHFAILLTWIAFILFAAASIPANHFKQKLGHPMYAGIKIWAFAHLIANGRLGDIILFVAFLIWAVAGFSISRRRDRLAGLPRISASGKGTVVTLVAGTAVWIVFALWLHKLLIGVSPIMMG